MPLILPSDSDDKREMVNWPKSEEVKEDKMEEDKVNEEDKEDDSDSNAPSRFYRLVLDNSNKKSSNSNPAS
jgi:hypothetical protein